MNKERQKFYIRGISSKDFPFKEVKADIEIEDDVEYDANNIANFKFLIAQFYNVDKSNVYIQEELQELYNIQQMIEEDRKFEEQEESRQYFIEDEKNRE